MVVSVTPNFQSVSILITYFKNKYCHFTPNFISDFVDNRDGGNCSNQSNYLVAFRFKNMQLMQ